MVAGQLSLIGATASGGTHTSSQSGEAVPRCLAQECGFALAAPDDVGLGRQLLSLALAGASVANGAPPEIACTMSYSTQANDNLKTFRQPREQE